jgi:CubicO group peptidase (beta-lactamase class C family)
MLRQVALAAAAALMATPAFAQDRTRGIATEIDEIFRWATPATPGCAVAVSREGELVVGRAYGAADLARGVPITTSTIFDVGSVQKQFTAASILLLVEKGRLSLSDDVRNHVPELPDYGHTITLDHLLTHTSGIRDWPGMLSMAADDPHVLTWVLRQRGLNFAPGEEWSYSSSGYELLKEIVARASGMSFSDFTRTRLFEPLGMRSTAYHQDMRADIENLALAYDRDGDGWKVDMMLGNRRGGGALLSTVTDLLTWHEALVGGLLGAFVTEKIQEPTTLNNGRTLTYGRALFVDADRDGRRVWHTGGAAGYSTFLGGYPERGLAIATTCNLDGGSSRAAAPVLNLFLPPMPDGSAAGASTQNAPAGASAEGVKAVDLRGRAGLFFNERTGQPLRLVVNDSRLTVVGGRPLVAVAADRFRNPPGSVHFMSQDEFELRFLAEDRLVLRSMEGETTRYRRARGWTPDPAELSAFAGRYGSDELGAVFRIEAGDGGIVGRLEHSPDVTVELTPVDPDTFMMRMMVMRFQQDGAGNVVGFDFSIPTVRDLRFTRLSDDDGKAAPRP